MIYCELNNGRKKRIKRAGLKGLVLQKKVLVKLFGFVKQQKGKCLFGDGRG